MSVYQMAADTSGICLLGAMDSLWFHQIVLFSPQSLSLLPHENLKTRPLSSSESSDASSRNNSSNMSVISQQEMPPVASDESISQDRDQQAQQIKISRQKEKPTKLQLTNPSSKTRCHSSSPVSAKNKSRKLRHRHRHSSYSGTWIPQKTRSCESLIELELEEVKGFMDLGFTFKREYFTNRLIKLLPGLQRIDVHQNIKFSNNTLYLEEEGAPRPYLREAWDWTSVGEIGNSEINRCRCAYEETSEGLGADSCADRSAGGLTIDH